MVSRKIEERPCPYHAGKWQLRCQYFEIGLARTGSRSIAKAVKSLGLRAAHGFMYCSECVDDAKQKLEDGNCDLDIYKAYDYCGHFVFVHWKQLAEQREDAKFILPIRPRDAWLHAVTTTIFKPSRTIRLQEGGSNDPWFAKLFMPDLSFTEERWLALYDRHLHEVQEYFAGTDRLLVIDLFNLSDVERWQQLVAFLGREGVEHSEEFPHWIHKFVPPDNY